MGTGNADSAGPSSQSAGLVPDAIVGGDRFILKKQLGQGGMGVVWLAFDQRLNEVVALKFLSSEIRNDPMALDDMRRETLKSHKLSHPNIIRIHDLFEVSGELPFISMEFVEGPSLAKHKAEQAQRCFEWEYARPLVQQLCEALDYAHEEGVIHRDLKPANMMLDRKGRLKLADFGIAALGNSSKSRMANALGNSGTPAYMSPQQMDGKLPQVTDDIYALGATLYELLTSRPPFFTGDILHQARTLAPDRIDQRLADLGIRNAVPDDVSAMIMACLAKNPEQRPASARAIAEWIGLELAASSAGSRVIPSVRGQAGPRIRGGSIALGAVLALAVGTFWWNANQRNSTIVQSGAVEAGWRRLLAGNSLQNAAYDPLRWQLMSDGAFSALGKQPSTLMSTEAYTNFEVKVEVRYQGRGYGAFLLRGNRPASSRGGFPDGYQVIVGEAVRGVRKSGSLLDYRSFMQDVVDSPAKEDAWFTLHCIMIGNRLVVKINDQMVLDRVDRENRYPSGHVGLIHVGVPTLAFRNVRVKTLPDDNAAALAEVRLH